MTDKKKTMDFFRPVRATDPLVRHAKPQPKSVPVPTKTPNKQPVFRSVPSEKETKTRRPEKLIKSSTVKLKTSEETVVPPKKPIKTSIQPKMLKKSPAEPKPSEKIPPEEKDEDDWFIEFEPESPVSRKKNVLGSVKSKPKQGKVSYPFGGESPFLKSVEVEKRPLSDSVPKKNPFDDPNFGRDQKSSLRPDPVRISPKSKKTDDRLSMAVIIIITVLLGVATGVGVFFLIAK